MTISDDDVVRKPINGRYAKTVRRTDRDAQILEAFHAGAHPRDIAAEYNLSRERTDAIIKAAIDGRYAEASAGAQDRVLSEIAATRLRLTEQLNRLTSDRNTVIATLDRPHFVAQYGKVVEDLDGSPMVDDAFVLSAMATLAKIEAQITSTEAQLGRLADREDRIIGLSKPPEVKHAGTIRYELVGVDLSDLQ